MSWVISVHENTRHKNFESLGSSWVIKIKRYDFNILIDVTDFHAFCDFCHLSIECCLVREIFMLFVRLAMLKLPSKVCSVRKQKSLTQDGTCPNLRHAISRINLKRFSASHHQYRRFEFSICRWCTLK